MVSAATVVALLGMCGSVWWIAGQARTPAQQAASASPPPSSEITGKVSDEPLVERLALSGHVGATAQISIVGTAPQGALRAVVTALPVRNGGSVSAGTVVAEVSGRPVIVLSGSFPAYRDLRVGDQGADVRQLQRALQSTYGVPVTGTYGEKTATAVRKLYENAGYPAPIAQGAAESANTADTGTSQDSEGRGGAQTDGGTGDTPQPVSSPTPQEAGSSSNPIVKPGEMFPAAEVAYVGSLPAAVVNVPGKVGAAADKPLVVLGSGKQQVRASLTAEEHARLRNLPDGARILFGQGPFEGRSGTLVGVPADGESVEKKGEEPRLEAVFEPSGATSAENEGAAQQVMIELQRSPEDSVTVPVSAVWTDLGGGSVVTTVTGDGDQRKVPVEVVFSADGMAAVRAVDGTLSPGASVLLGHRSNGEDS
ncbi:peptidoglycan-binding domain-containing protein [Streptomyces sudanensis]|uniref:peptidoglycan-binding domain-containing protein n=1 Tax=Streptomyces sudanensis TaxID=436397 RepID=UPI0020CDB2FA|nr:peptidoglycan-binding domain-containing protein [Streptomyces sudanensis]MCP9957544.1 peptidoglycan-binding protein [Streptomyces sudanensis]MCP9986677.1 peptidoglycan-binding protein [Streptomyces sudanensis]MCQ0001913.1 peptidoglycan-binding protein [Streptomyces sudanensis]